MHELGNNGLLQSIEDLNVEIHSKINSCEDEEDRHESDLLVDEPNETDAAWKQRAVGPHIPTMSLWRIGETA